MVDRTFSIGLTVRQLRHVGPLDQLSTDRTRCPVELVKATTQILPKPYFTTVYLSFLLSMMHVNSTSIQRHLAAFLALFVSLSFSSCATVKKLGSAIPMPGLPSLPDVTTLKRVLPGSEDRVNDADPNIAFDPRGNLRPGHTLRLQVNESLRSARSLWKGLVMVELDGTVDLGKTGKAEVGGKSAHQAALAIESAFRVGGFTSSPVSVHIVSVENVSIIALNGDLAAGPQPLPMYDGITVQEAIRLAGGRSPKSEARGIYLTREGKRRFFRSAASADTQWRIAPGDIITLSSEL